MPKLRIELLGPLMVAGGQTTGLGVDLATACRYEEGRRVPYIPATALRGAVRLQLEALLRGARREATGPYPFDPPVPASAEGEPATPPAGEPTDTLVARLFGYSGKSGSRTGSAEGSLRFSDAVPVEPARAAAALSVRPGVELDDYTRTAADRKLFFREVAELAADPLVFEAHLVTGDARAEELEALQAAVETVGAIGAGKASGGGTVRIRWQEDTSGLPGTRVSGEPARATRARLELTLLEPAHFGDGGPRGNHQATRTHVPGATVRGALAWALLRAKRALGEDRAFQGLFVGDVSFGDALLVAAAGEEPVVHPATVGKLRGSSPPCLSDRLITELAREEVNRALDGEGLYLRADEGEKRFEPLSAYPDEGLLRRTRTRVSIDRHTGAAAPRRLFSIQQVEPWMTPAKQGEEPERPRFLCWVEGLDPERPDLAALLARLEGLPVFVGAGRNHGMGLVQLEIRFVAEPASGWGRQRVLDLGQAVRRQASQFASRAGLQELQLPADTVPLALVATSSYLPSAEREHPLAAWQEMAGEPVRCFINDGRSGGFDQHPDHPQPLKDLRPAVGAGSVFVYRMKRHHLEELLAAAAPALVRGVGQRTHSGCGRFELLSMDALKERKG